MTLHAIALHAIALQEVELAAPFLLSASLLFRSTSDERKLFSEQTDRDVRALAPLASEEAIEGTTDAVWTTAIGASAWSASKTQFSVTGLGFYLLLPRQVLWVWVTCLAFLVAIGVIPRISRWILCPSRNFELVGHHVYQADFVNGCLIVIGLAVAVVPRVI